MTISLDGLVADQNGYAGRLDPELAALRPPPTPRMRSSRLVQSSWGEGRSRWRTPTRTSATTNSKCRFSCWPISRRALHRNKSEQLTFTFVTDVEPPYRGRQLLLRRLRA